MFAGYATGSNDPAATLCSAGKCATTAWAGNCWGAGNDDPAAFSHGVGTATPGGANPAATAKHGTAQHGNATAAATAAGRPDESPANATADANATATTNDAATTTSTTTAICHGLFLTEITCYDSLIILFFEAAAATTTTSAPADATTTYAASNAAAECSESDDSSTAAARSLPATTNLRQQQSADATAAIRPAAAAPNAATAATTAAGLWRELQLADAAPSPGHSSSHTTTNVGGLVVLGRHCTGRTTSRIAEERPTPSSESGSRCRDSTLRSTNATATNATPTANSNQSKRRSE